MKLKKFAAVIASFAMAASFSACGNQTSESNNGSTQDTTAAVQDSDADTEENAADVSATAEDETKPEEPAASSEDVHTNEFDLENGTVLLNNGIEMPILGIGTFALTPEQASDSVYWALSDGYHLIDTANAYNNEEGVAEGIKRAIDEGKVKREDIFLTAKIWPDAYNMEGIDATLERLGVDYVDLMLLHQPFGDITAGYQALEQALADGKVRAIGLSNFENIDNFELVMENASVPPAVLQVETHPYFQQLDTMEYIDQYGTVIEAWYPLGGRGNTQDTA